MDVADSVKEAFHLLPELTGGAEILDQALSVAPEEKASQAIHRLKQIDELLHLYGVEDHVTFDLSMSGSYGYYTGIIFRAYTYGTGDAVVRGGRYDHLLEKFGMPLPAIGFGVDVEAVTRLLLREGRDRQPQSSRLYTGY